MVPITPALKPAITSLSIPNNGDTARRVVNHDGLGRLENSEFLFSPKQSTEDFNRCFLRDFSRRFFIDSSNPRHWHGIL